MMLLLFDKTQIHSLDAVLRISQETNLMILNVDNNLRNSTTQRYPDYQSIMLSIIQIKTVNKSSKKRSTIAVSFAIVSISFSLLAQHLFLSAFMINCFVKVL